MMMMMMMMMMQAVSDIIHGGDLVTTVCHSTPFVIDTSPPNLHSVDDPIFDEDFRLLAVYFSASDEISGVARVEFGLGKTKYDVMIRRYIPYEIRGTSGNTYLLNEEFETASGTPAWIRLKIVNNVGLSVTGNSDSPILIDNTPPVPGHVMDGEGLGRDVCCQSNADQICVQWEDFADPESNIGRCVDVHGDKVHVKVKATNRAGSDVTVTSDGMEVDHTPPVLQKLTTSDGGRYQKRDDKLDFVWKFVDEESGIAEYRSVVFEKFQGRKMKIWPKASDYYVTHSNDTTPGLLSLPLSGRQLKLTNGATYSVKVTAINKAKLATSEESAGVTVDTTPPVILPRMIFIEVRFARRGEEEEVNEHGEDCVMVDGINIDGSSGFTTLLEDFNLTVSRDDSRVQYQVSVVVVNGAGMTSAVAKSKPLVILPGNVAGVVLDGLEQQDEQFSRDRFAISASFSGFGSEACGILGREWTVDAEDFLSSASTTEFFVILYAANGAGLTRKVHKKVQRDLTPPVFNGVKIVTSPKPGHVVRRVWDGLDPERDADGQSEVNMLQGRWLYSDPCPIISAQWSVTEIGGRVVTNFTDIPGNEFQNDRLDLENFKTYVNVVKIKDAMGRTFTAFSDGVTVLVREPQPALVRDGLATRFAVGTDRRYSRTKSNIHAFQSVGLATNFTFQGLNLTSYTVTYYVTVRGHSAAGSYAESSSDGVRVGFSGEVTPGRVSASSFQSSTDSVQVTWSDFASDMGSLRYYIGVSTAPSPWDNATHDCGSVLQGNFTYDTRELQLQDDMTPGREEDRLTMVQDLKLKHKGNNAGESWQISILVNGKISGEFSGLVFPVEVTMSIYTWNVDDYVPPVDDPLDPFRAVTEVTYIAMPLPQRPLCSYGAPFRDSESGVKDVYVGLSDDVNETANVAPFQHIKSYCPPCLLGCQSICSAACKGDKFTGDYSVLSFSLTGLDLLATNGTSFFNVSLSYHSSPNATHSVGNVFDLPMYYLDVRVLSQSGLVTEVKSRPLLIDVTPPELKYAYAVDPTYADDEDMEFLGNNYTVGLQWDASDDVSSILEQWISLGTQPGLGDVVPRMTVDR
nr:hypothetical protein BaRGS_029598 [Batillaria attramentaria]